MEEYGDGATGAALVAAAPLVAGAVSAGAWIWPVECC